MKLFVKGRGTGSPVSLPFFFANFSLLYAMLQALKSCKNPREKAQIIWDFYQSARLQSDLEPVWIHPDYELVQKYLENSIKKEELLRVAELIKSHEMPDGTEVSQYRGKPKSPVRIVHQGWKIGSPTWVFMGRNLHPNATQYLGKGWVAVCREVPSDLYKLFDSSIPNLVWVAYSLNKSMTDEDWIGPAVFYDEFILALERVVGKLPENPKLGEN